MRVQIKGETLDEAINNAMIDLSTTSDNIMYDLIQKGTSGFLGIGSKPFIIEAYKKDDKEEKYKKSSINKKEKLIENNNGIYEFKSEKNINNKNEEKVEKMIRNPEEVFKKAEKFLKPILDEFKTNIKLDYTVNEETNTIIVNMNGENMGVIIGKHGQTLDALQHIVNTIINNGETNRVRIRIDSENYRDKRNKTLEDLARSVAKNVRKTHKNYELEPMSSYERRIIHSVLQKEKNIETVSVGMDKERHVVVKYRR